MKVLASMSNGNIYGKIEYGIYTNGHTHKRSKKTFKSKFSDFETFEESQVENIGQNGLIVEVTKQLLNMYAIILINIFLKLGQN